MVGAPLIVGWIRFGGWQYGEVNAEQERSGICVFLRYLCCLLFKLHYVLGFCFAHIQKYRVNH